MDAPNKKPAGQGGQFAEQGTLFEPSSFSPVWPSPATLPDKALERLIAGQHLTHPQFLAATGSWRCAAAIKELRYLGWPVLTDELPRPGRRPIADYWLAPHAIGAAKGVRHG